ncbi:MAG TPA: sugar kinase [Solirubrobacteraceae bacterium]
MSDAGLVTLGETMGLITQTGVGHVHNGESMTFGLGGSESNVAIGVRRLGVPATWIGRLGDDPPGRLIQRELRAEGVEVVAIEDPAATGLMTRWRPTAGRGHVIYHRRDSAGSHLQASDVPEELVAGAAVLHGTGITLALGPGPAGALTRAIAVAREAGATVSFDVNYRRALWSEADAAAAIRSVLGDCDLVCAGLDEARILTGHTAPERAALDLESLGPRQVLITLGERGCLARIDGTTFEVPAPEVTVVDTVGAGDAFVAGYLAELIGGQPPVDRLATAVSAGALAVTAPGDWEGMPDREALERYGTDEPVIR